MLKKDIDNRLSKLNRRKKWRAVGCYRKRALKNNQHSKRT